jgi:hypothetical protein
MSSFSARGATSFFGRRRKRRAAAGASTRRGNTSNRQTFCFTQEMGAIGKL